MQISMVVIVRNEENRIKEFLDSVIIQEYINENEVLFVDGNSSDKTLDIIKEYATKYKFIKFIKCSEYGYSYQRNIGARNANGEYVLYVSGDTILTKNILKKYLTYIPEYDIIQGTILNSDNVGIKNKNLLIACTKIYENYINTFCEMFSTVNVCIRKKLLLNREFNENLNSFEDKEWFLAYEGKVKFKRVQNIIIRHLVHESVSEYRHKVLKEAIILGNIAKKSKNYENINFFGWITFTINISILIIVGAISSFFCIFKQEYLVAMSLCFLPYIYIYIWKIRKYKDSIFNKIQLCLYLSGFSYVNWKGILRGYFLEN
ncbi:MAG: glycosyltransferase family 2 protein [Sarcina sp.]